MATKRSQKVFIWVIAVTMLVGSVGAYFLLILSNDNAARDAERIQVAQEEFQKEYTEYQQKLQEQTKELSDKYYSEFSKYESRAKAFSADEVTELKKKDLKEGDGEELTEESNFMAYYIGWTPDGKIFDSSIEGESLKTPISVQPGGVISGWTEGAAGMKVGGVRELTIPAEKAYGEAGSGEAIPPNTPLKFVIMVVPTPEGLEEPEISQELLDYYGY